MKKLLAALLTFTFSVLAFNVLKAEKAATVEAIPVKKAADISAPEIESAPEIVMTEQVITKSVSENNESSKPFFDSFDKEKFDKNDYQYFGGWLIADEFKGMKEVWTIFLERSDENSKDEKLIWSASILTQHTDGSPNDDADFHSIQIKTEGYHLSFKTSKYRGIEYKFDGKFFRNGKEFANDEKVLRGTLQKLVKGKPVAKFTADFAYYEPRCFH